MYNNQIKKIKFLEQIFSVKNEIECKNKLKEIEYKNFNMHRVSTPMPNLRYFEVHLTEHCNLNCQSCTHFSPLADEEYTDLNQFEADMKRMSELTNGDVNVISLMGGEPLLHPHCTKFFDITRKYFPQTTIKLVTNGILLLQQKESFWESMNVNNITLAPTKYPINIDWDKVKEKTKNYNINLLFFNEEKVEKKSFKIPLDLTGENEANTSFLHCWIANRCTFLSKGKIYTCVFPATIKHFNKYFNKNIPVRENDSIDINKVSNIKEILDFVSKPMPFCSYCKINCQQNDIDWAVSEKQLKEWI